MISRLPDIAIVGLLVWLGWHVLAYGSALEASLLAEEAAWLD